jgi:hypothetical protein
MECPLCLSLTDLFHQHQAVGALMECSQCGFIFKPATEHLALTQQKERYDLHNNRDLNEGYKAFLNQVIEPLKPYLKKSSRILDWGSGPFPALQKILNEQGFDIEIFDPIYSPESPEGLFDVITCTEVIEHFLDPREDFEKIFSHLNPEGLLAIMTEIYRPSVSLATWWYAKDPTHVCFYQEKTLHYVSQHWNLEILFQQKNVCLFKKVSQ